LKFPETGSQALVFLRGFKPETGNLKLGTFFNITPPKNPLSILNWPPKPSFLLGGTRQGSNRGQGRMKVEGRKKGLAAFRRTAEEFDGAGV
jgi:hypothetical protein